VRAVTNKGKFAEKLIRYSIYYSCTMWFVYTFREMSTLAFMLPNIVSGSRH